MKGTLRITQTLYRINDYDPNAPTKTKLVFQEPKTKLGKRSIPIPTAIIPDLMRHKQNQDIGKKVVGDDYNTYNLVFVNENGGPYDARGFIKRFHSLIKKAGLKHTNFHALRHSFATRLLEVDEHPKVVQELLGHSNIAMTLDTYSHVLPEKKNAAAQKLNALFENGIEYDSSKKADESDGGITQPVKKEKLE